MSDSRLTRQQIYDRIRQSSKEEFILAEMKRLGFWDKQGTTPSLPEQMIKKEGELQRELQQLYAEKQRFNNKEEVLKAMRKERMEKAKAKRAVTKQRKEDERQARAARWAILKEKDIIYLGEDVSGGLDEETNNGSLLQTKNLPAFESVTDLARAAGISISELKFLSFHRRITTASHYKRFTVAKKSGGKRIISAPMPRLKSLQYWILKNILSPVPLHDAANGFVPGRSILSNAAKHIGKDVVLNIDLKDFFPTISFARVKGMFCKMGYSEKIATIFALVCTEPEREEVSLDGKKYYVARGERLLPQGAPTSPAITNIICYKLDRRFTGMALATGYTYTRYADDLTFSATDSTAAKKAEALLWRIKRIIKDEGFVLHPDKVHVMRKGNRQEVTGIVVNHQPGINRKTLHRFRALIHQLSSTGPEGKRWKGDNIQAEMTGYAGFIAQVKPELGARLQNQLSVLFARPDIQQQLKDAALRRG